MIALNLNAIKRNNFSQLPVGLQFLILIIFLLVCSILSYWLIFHSDIHLYRKSLLDEKKLQREFENKQRIANLKYYQNQIRQLKKAYQEKLVKLSKEDEIPDLLNDISKAGIDCGLIMEFFAPQQAEPHDFIVELAIDMRMVGEYQQLLLFLSRVLQFDRLISFHNFAITKVSHNNEKTDLDMNKLLRMEIRLKIYQNINKKLTMKK